MLFSRKSRLVLVTHLHRVQERSTRPASDPTQLGLAVAEGSTTDPTGSTGSTEHFHLTAPETDRGLDRCSFRSPAFPAPGKAFARTGTDRGVCSSARNKYRSPRRVPARNCSIKNDSFALSLAFHEGLSHGLSFVSQTFSNSGSFQNWKMLPGSECFHLVLEHDSHLCAGQPWAWLLSHTVTLLHPRTVIVLP